MNKLWIPNHFRALFRAKRSGPIGIFEGVKEGIRSLRVHPLPATLGEKKRWGLEDVLALRVNRDNRILYGVREIEGAPVVALFRVCSHEQYREPENLTASESAFFSQTAELVLQQTAESEQVARKIESSAPTGQRVRVDPRRMYR